jgi:alpha-L-fucosidase
MMPKAAEANEKMAWWREARFGLFIHWGLYAVPAGVWKGKPCPAVSEWIMKREAIPVREYEQLAPQFNPVRFDAEEWVELAKAAGMKYIVITAKHHDGFAMYHSACTDYNIVDATPFKRDPMRELAAACRKAGLKLCFYYSQYQDWHHPDAGGNDWDYPDNEAKQFERYMQDKALPQVRELLTRYGPVGLIWFDTPMALTAEQSGRLAAAVRELQPDCLINSRVGGGFHDYKSTGDNAIPADVYDEDWEVPATLNDTWGFKLHDHNWKSARQLVRLLIDVNRKGGNYLLNIGPRADGTIPEPSVEILREVGRWMETNGEAIYGTRACPTFPYTLPWGNMTYKPGKLFLHIFDWRPRIVIAGLRSRVRSAYLLADAELKLEYVQHPSAFGQKMHRLQLSLPEAAQHPIAAVVVLELEGELTVDRLTL